MNNQKNTTKVVTGIVRLSYANVWEATSINGGTPKYSVSLIIPKSDTKTIDAIKAAISTSSTAICSRWAAQELLQI